MTQTPMQKAVEAGAKAIQNECGCEGGLSMHRVDAQAALTAALASLEADGWKLMPREATEGMSHGGAVSLEHPTVRMEGPSAHNKRRAARAYEAMFNAAPEVD